MSEAERLLLLTVARALIPVVPDALKLQLTQAIFAVEAERHTDPRRHQDP